MRNIFLICLLALAATIFFSCDVTIDPVAPSSLANYDASTTLPADKDAALSGAGYAVMTSVMYSMMGAQGNSEIATIGSPKLTIPQLKSQLEDQINALLLNPVASSKTVTDSVTIQEPTTENTNGLIDANISIINEDLVVDSVKIATINKIAGDVVVKTTGYPELTSVNVEGSGDADIDFFEMAMDNGNTINSGKLVGKAKIDADASFAGTVFTLKYNVGIAFSLGLSVSGTNGGKYVANLGFNSKDTIIADSATQTEASNPYAQLDVTLTLEVYNNEGALQSTYTYTEEELMTTSM